MFFDQIIDFFISKYKESQLKDPELDKAYNELDKIRKRIRENMASLESKLQQISEASINIAIKIAALRDPYTGDHQKNVADLSIAIANEMKYSNNIMQGVYLAGVIHDVGKMAIPSEILTKPGKISKEEFNLIKTHTQVGHDVLKDIDFPWPVADTVLQHHERLDGSGYPRGLKEKDILIEAKILGVADVVEAMSSYRPYRPALGIDAALEEISINSGVKYDPDIVKACINLFKKKKFQFHK